MLRKLVRYAAVMSGANTLTGLLTFAVTMFGAISRPKGAMGNYATYMLIYGIAQSLLISGANPAIQRFAADDDLARRRFTALVYLSFGALLVVFSLAGVGLGLWRQNWGIALAMFGSPWVVVWWWGRYLLRSKFDAKREAILMGLASLSNSGFQFLFLYFTRFEDALIYGDFAALLASGVAALVMMPKGIGIPFREIMRTRIDRSFLADVYDFARPLWVGGQVASSATYIQGFYTRGGLGAEAMGAYGVMQTMWQFAFKPMEYVQQAALPGLVTEKTDRPALYRDIARLCIVSFPLIGIAVAAGIPLLFDLLRMERKWGEVPVLIILMAAAVPLQALQNVVSQYAVAEGRSAVVLRAQVVQVVVLSVLLYPASRAFGLSGVVTAGNIAQIANGLVFVVEMHKDYRSDMDAGLAWSLLASVSTLAALAPAYYFRTERLAWLAVLPGIAIYLTGMFLTRTIRKADVVRVLGAFRAKKSQQPA